jgi:hypothetical protein
MSKVFELLKELFVQGWDLTPFETRTTLNDVCELKVVCAKSGEKSFTIVILYPSKEIVEWLDSKCANVEGLGALFG